MERTKGYSVVNDTPKAPKNQGFSVKRLQNGTSFSSAARYDHFDTLPCNTSAAIFYHILPKNTTRKFFKNLLTIMVKSAILKLTILVKQKGGGSNYR